MSGSNILVTFAVAEEARPFQAKLRRAHGVETLLTGIGSTQVRRTLLARLRGGDLQLVVSSGFAGALNPTLSNGDLVYDCSLASHLDAPLKKAGARPVRFHCSPDILLTPETKRQAREATGADAVEMESVTIRNLCREHQIACAIVRVISDSAAERMPVDFNTCMKPDGRVRWVALIRQCLRRPAAFAGLLRLHGSTRRGADRLANVLFELTIPPGRNTHP